MKSPRTASAPIPTPENALKIATQAAKAAGTLIRTHLGSDKKVNSAVQHDIKLELDVRSQKLIEEILLRLAPSTSILGEEGNAGTDTSASRWVVDPIDGTVNFAYGIPHACVSIAFQTRTPDGRHTTTAGVVFDPFCNELWTATANGPALLNGVRIQASRRHLLREAIISIGFAKQKSSMAVMMPRLLEIIPRVRKIRVMGSAALSIVYVASGRLDAYLEIGLRLWDIAAGALILERAGGDFWHRPMPGAHRFEIAANNGPILTPIRRCLRKVDPGAYRVRMTA